MIYSGIIKKVIKEAEKSNMPVFKVGAVIFDGKRIISSGHNKKGICSRIHPKYQNDRDSVHAEQNAIIKVKDWVTLSGTSMIVVRLNKSGHMSMGYPCKMCLNMMDHVGIKEVYYSDYSGEILRHYI